MTTRVVVVGPFHAHHAARLPEQVSTPISVAVSASLLDDNICPLLLDAEIAVTSYWSPAMGQAARQLRLLHVPGAGWDKIDGSAIPKGVLVANCYEHEQAIAEYVLMMCLALSRELFQADRTIRQANWRMSPTYGHALYPELGGRTIGLIGLGRIGRSVAQLAGAFRMHTIGIDAMPLSRNAQQALGLTWVGTPGDIDRLLTEADFVVIAVPLNEQSRGMLGRRELRLLRPTAFLINPARAELIEEQALYEALRDGAFAGAALDPWWHYPKGDECVAPSHYPFAALENVIMTPHVSGSSIETMDRRWAVVAANISRFLRGESLVNVVKDLSTI